MHFKTLIATAITGSALLPCVLAVHECFTTIYAKTPFRSSYPPEYYKASLLQMKPGEDYYFKNPSPFEGCLVKFDEECTQLIWERLFYFPETTACPPADAKVDVPTRKEVAPPGTKVSKVKANKPLGSTIMGGWFGN